MEADLKIRRLLEVLPLAALLAGLYFAPLNWGTQPSAFAQECEDGSRGGACSRPDLPGFQTP